MQIIGGEEGPLDFFRRGRARVPKCFRCKADKPLVELIDRSRNVGFPEARFVSVDVSGHRVSPGKEIRQRVNLAFHNSHYAGRDSKRS